jgi:hypothetical protein
MRWHLEVPLFGLTPLDAGMISSWSTNLDSSTSSKRRVKGTVGPVNA